MGKIEDIGKKDIYKVPEGYFEDLEGRIQQRISRPEGRVVSFYQEQRWRIAAIAAAACLALILVFQPWRGSELKQTDVMALLADISTEDCMAYLQYSDLTVEQIAASATAEELNEVLNDFVAVPEVEEEDLDLLYEKFGATSDEKLKSL